MGVALTRHRRRSGWSDRIVWPRWKAGIMWLLANAGTAEGYHTAMPPSRSERRHPVNYAAPTANAVRSRNTLLSGFQWTWAHNNLQKRQHVACLLISGSWKQVRNIIATRVVDSICYLQHEKPNTTRTYIPRNGLHYSLNHRASFGFVEANFPATRYTKMPRTLVRRRSDWYEEHKLNWRRPWRRSRPCTNSLCRHGI